MADHVGNATETVVNYKLVFKRINSTDASSPVYKEVGIGYVEILQIPDADAMLKALKDRFNIEELDIDHFWNKKKMEEPDLRSFIRNCHYGVLKAGRKVGSTIAVVLKPGVEYPKLNANAGSSGAQTDGDVSEANICLDDETKPWDMMDPDDPALSYNTLTCPKVEECDGDVSEEFSDTW